jgi:Ca2+/Na+ antiporter
LIHSQAMSTASGDSARGDGSSQVHHRRKSHTPSFEQIEQYQIHGRSHLQSHVKKTEDSADDDDEIPSESIFTKIKTHAATIVVIFLLLAISLGCSLNVNAALWLSALQTTVIALCALRWEHDQWMAKIKGNFPVNICPLICQFFMFSIPAMLAGLLVFVAGTSPFREVAAAMHAPCFRCQAFSPALAQLRSATGHPTK